MSDREVDEMIAAANVGPSGQIDYAAWVKVGAKALNIESSSY
jgi:hypothetical protein